MGKLLQVVRRYNDRRTAPWGSRKIAGLLLSKYECPFIGNIWRSVWRQDFLGRWIPIIDIDPGGVRTYLEPRKRKKQPCDD